MRRLAVLALLGLPLVGASCGSSPDEAPLDPPVGTPDGSLDGTADTSTGGDSTAVEDAPFNLDTGNADAASDGAFGTCGDGGSCPAAARCKYGVCIPDRGNCAKNDDCPGDSYCDPTETPGVCVPYGVPATKTNDETCQKVIDPGKVAPSVQCEWEDAPAGDPTTGMSLVYTSTYVADLNLDEDPNKLRPSIVMTTFMNTTAGGRVGMLRVFDGRTCTEQMRIGGPDDPEKDLNRPGYGTQWAIGDLDGDVGTLKGHPEIVGMGRVGDATNSVEPLTVIAYSIDTTDLAKPKLVRKFRGRVCDPTDPTKDTLVTFGTNSANFAPGLWDLDDDGKPEIVVDQMVFDHDGCLLNPPSSYVDYLSLGVISSIADADHDGKPDLIRYDGIYGWNTTTKTWTLKPFFTQYAVHKPGLVAIADLGLWSTLPGKEAEKLPEVVVVSAASNTFSPGSTGTIRVQTVEGNVVFGPIDLFHVYDGVTSTTQYGGHGGAPTIGDFDGDGLPEIAAAANQFYVVYDPDCTANGLPLDARPTGKCDRSKVVLPAGVTSLPPGILWAKASKDYSSSATGSSIFDFNGDGVAEAVYRDECYLRVYDGPSGNVIFSAPATSGTGYELPVVADVNGNFGTQIVVPRAGGGGGCPSPDPLFPASGPLVAKTGFVILRDPMDRWASSRPIWNQHAYSVTHVTDDARIPKSSAVPRNWETKGLNNFRQNVQGSLGALKLADLTVELADLTALCAATGGSMTLTARVCNRGTNPVTDGVTVSFGMREKGDAGDAGASTAICSTTTPKLLAPGDCTTVQCSGTVDATKDVFVSVDPEGKIADCHPGNNAGASALSLCPTVK